MSYNNELADTCCVIIFITHSCAFEMKNPQKGFNIIKIDYGEYLYVNNVSVDVFNDVR